MDRGVGVGRAVDRHGDRGDPAGVAWLDVHGPVEGRTGVGHLDDEPTPPGRQHPAYDVDRRRGEPAVAEGLAPGEGALARHDDEPARRPSHDDRPGEPDGHATGVGQAETGDGDLVVTGRGEAHAHLGPCRLGAGVAGVSPGGSDRGRPAAVCGHATGLVDVAQGDRQPELPRVARDRPQLAGRRAWSPAGATAAAASGSPSASADGQLLQRHGRLGRARAGSRGPRRTCVVRRVVEHRPGRRSRRPPRPPASRGRPASACGGADQPGRTAPEYGIEKTPATRTPAPG